MRFYRITSNWKKGFFYFLVILFLGIFINQQFFALNNGRQFAKITKDAVETDAFRRMMLSENNYSYLKALAKDDEEKFFRYLTSLMILHEFDLENNSVLTYSKRKLDQLVTRQMSLKEDAYLEIVSSYQAIFADMEIFPVAFPANDENATCSFEDSWFYERTYGGKRKHEGADLMAKIDQSGYYPILSVSDGVVEKIGWLPQGGYRIGIRSPKGAYYYYAHLSEYAKDFQPGEKVKAGTLLGFMGDTGYGEEGTTGKFPVHLHFGIYIQTSDQEELSINPYYLLKIWQDTGISMEYPQKNLTMTETETP